MEEADKKHAEEVVATKLAADQEIKEAEARAIKATKSPSRGFLEADAA
jgi:hypothetical protein